MATARLARAGRARTYDAALPEPLSVIRIYDASLRMWREHFGQLTALAVLLEAPIVVIELALHVTAGIRISTTTALSANIISAPLAIYGSLSHHFLSGLLEKVVGAKRHGHRMPTLLETFEDLPWIRLLVADLASTLLILLGTIALIVPGVLLATWLTPLLVVVNLERRTVRQSMGRSRQLVRGHFWRVLLIGIVLVGLVEVLGQIAADLVHRAFHAEWVEVLVEASASALLLPLAALPIVFLTFDLVDLDAVRISAGSVVPEPGDAPA